MLLAGPTMPIRFFLRSLSLLVVLALHFTPAARAVGLGDVISLSPVGQPLRVEIRLPGEGPERAEGCIRLIVDRHQPADGITGVDRARIVIRRSAGEAVAVITDPAPTSHPILRLRLEEICDSNMQRDYLLLLSEPPEISAPAQAQAQPSTAAARAPSAETARPRPPRGYVRWTARGGESLAALAARRHPGDATAQARFIERVRQANPEHFGPQGPSSRTRLAAGTRLLLPRERPAQTPPVQDRPPMPDTSPAATAVAPQPAKPPSAKADQLVVQGREAGSGPPLKLARELGTDARAAAPSEPERDLMRREQQLQATVESQVAMQVDVAQRLRKLEALQAELRTRLTESPAPAPAPVAPVVEAPVARPPRSESSHWPMVLALLGGAGVAVGLWYRRRRVPASGPARPTPAAQRRAAATPAGAMPSERSVAAIEQPADSVLWREPARVDEPQPAPATDVEPLPFPEQDALDWDFVPTGSVDLEVYPTLGDEELLAEHDSVIELAEIMLSFGRVRGAAETLAEFIRVHPTKSVAPWVKLLEVYRAADMQAEFEALSQRLNQTFNVVSITWDNYDEAMRRTPARLEDMPHLMERIEGLWGSADCLRYLDRLLRDNREGTRQGFAIGVADDILMLIAVLDYRLRLEKTLETA